MIKKAVIKTLALIVLIVTPLYPIGRSYGGEALPDAYKAVADGVITKLQLPPGTLAYLKTAEPGNFKGYKAVVYEVSKAAYSMPLTVYVSADLKTAIFGEVFFEGRSVSQELGLQPGLKKLPFDLKQKDRIIYNDPGKKTIFMFADPECPYCKQALRSIEQYVGKDYRFVVKHFPLESLHPEAKAIALKQQIEWLEKTRPDLSADSVKRRAEQIVSEDIEEGKKAGIDGTPYFVMDGKFLASLPIETQR